MITLADKLAETKRAEREARQAAQREHLAAKDKREAQRLAEAATSRDLRAYHGNSKRHLKEVKEVRSHVFVRSQALPAEQHAIHIVRG